MTQAQGAIGGGSIRRRLDLAVGDGLAPAHARAAR